MSLNEMKRCGWAPFQKAEIQISIRKKAACIVLLIPGRTSGPAMDFPLHCERFEQAGREIIAAAIVLGLLDTHSETVIVDVDAGPTPS